MSTNNDATRRALGSCRNELEASRLDYKNLVATALLEQLVKQNELLGEISRGLDALTTTIARPTTPDSPRDGFGGLH